MNTLLTSRGAAALTVLIALIALLTYDLGHSAPLNPYVAPAAIALGSDEAAGGAFCALVPARK